MKSSRYNRLPVFGLFLTFTALISDANAERISLGFDNDYVILGEARRIDDPIPTFRPHLGDLQSAVNADDDEVLFAWYLPNGYSPPNYRIAGQLLSADGAALGSTQFFHGALPGQEVDNYSDLHPRLAYNPASNQYLLATAGLHQWRYTSFGPAGRFLSAAGVQLSAPIGIDGVGSVHFLRYNPIDDNFLTVGFEDQQRKGIYSSILDSSGASLAASSRLDGLPNDPTSVGLAGVSHSTESNNYLALWTRHDPNRAVEGQLLDNRGNAVGSPITLASSNDPAFQGFYHVEVAYDGEHDQFLVAYDAYQGVRARLISAEGELIGDELVLSSVPPARPGGLTEFTLLFDDSLNRYVLATIRNEKFLDLRVFDSSGQRRGSPIEVAMTQEKMFEVEVASLGEGKFYAGWITGRLFGSSAQIHGRSLRLVPEPSSICLLLLGAMLAGAPRRRRSSQ
jgi:hypothetical protein